MNIRCKAVQCLCRDKRIKPSRREVPINGGANATPAPGTTRSLGHTAKEDRFLVLPDGSNSTQNRHKHHLDCFIVQDPARPVWFSNPCANWLAYPDGSKMLSDEEIELLRAEGKFPTQEQIDEIYRNSRLSLPTPIRLPITSAASFLVGLSLGTAQGSKVAGMRFRAEHAHKLPDTTTGWYLYHKSKNYHVAYGGIVEGVKMGTKIAFFTTAMLSIENMFDAYRGTADLLNTVTSCVTVAGALSLWSALIGRVS